MLEKFYFEPSSKKKFPWCGKMAGSPKKRTVTKASQHNQAIAQRFLDSVNGWGFRVTHDRFDRYLSAGNALAADMLQLETRKNRTCDFRMGGTQLMALGKPSWAEAWCSMNDVITKSQVCPAYNLVNLKTENLWVISQSAPEHTFLAFVKDNRGRWNHCYRNRFYKNVAPTDEEMDAAREALAYDAIGDSVGTCSNEGNLRFCERLGYRPFGTKDNRALVTNRPATMAREDGLLMDSIHAQYKDQTEMVLREMGYRSPARRPARGFA